MTSKEQARALCQQYLTSVAVNSTDGIAKHEQIRLNQQAATKLVTDIIAALDAAREEGRLIEEGEDPVDYIARLGKKMDEKAAADARRKMGEEIEAGLEALWHEKYDGLTRGDVLIESLAIVRKAAKVGLDADN